MPVQVIERLIESLVSIDSAGSAGVFAALVGLAALLFWLAVAPSRSQSDASDRLDGFLGDRDVIEESAMEKSFLRRAVVPLIANLTKALGSLTPVRAVRRIDKLLREAGRPWGLSAPDIVGIQILLGLLLGGGYLAMVRGLGLLGPDTTTVHLRNAAIVYGIAFLLPRLWLRSRADKRKNAILRAFPDALDLLSVSVDAGLALDSAMVRVCERWSNALTDEFSRVIVEMRVGTPRDTALQRMVDRAGVQDLAAFVGVLIQSSQLGVSIAETLHSQADQVRIRRRQRAEELAQQASVKMVFALVLLIFPALLVVLLGPGIPRIYEALVGL